MQLVAILIRKKGKGQLFELARIYPFEIPAQILAEERECDTL